MSILGRIENDVVVLDEPGQLPNGTLVVVTPRSTPRVHFAEIRQPVTLPIFPYDGTPDLDLTNDQIAEALDQEDASS